MKHKIEVSSATFSKLSNLIFGADFVHGGKPYRKGRDKDGGIEAIRLEKRGGKIHPNEIDNIYFFCIKEN
ncbi:hypothetical protein I7Q67_08450 [Neisseria meningitidis]|nr:hypothetical protein [Neisseria meningitidis]